MGVVESPVNTTVSITSSTTTVCKKGPGVLERIIIPTPVATATIKIYDHASSASGAVLIDTITIAASPAMGPISVMCGQNFLLGCVVVTAVATQSVSVVVS